MAEVLLIPYLSLAHIPVMPYFFLSVCLAFFLYYTAENVLYQVPFDSIL